MSAEPPNYVFTIFASIGFVLVTIPLRWHLEAWNTGTCLYMIWTGLGCLNGVINSIVWNGNVENKAPIWCDISSRLMIGSSVAIPAASLCINRRLYHIVTAPSVITSKAEKRRAVMIDLAIGLGIPVLEMILQYIVQGHRFNIFEDIGCYFFTYNTPVSFPLVYCWPVVIELVSAVYCSMTIYALLKRWRQHSDLNQLFAANNSISINRHFRLMALAGVELLLGVPWSVYVGIYLNISANGASESPINPWISWANVHSNFFYVGQFPAFEWKQSANDVLCLELERWAKVICAFLFFALFGFAEEARKNYRNAYSSIAKKIGYTTAGLSSSTRLTTGALTLPVFMTRKTNTDHDSFSTNLSIKDAGGVLDETKSSYSSIN